MTGLRRLSGREVVAAFAKFGFSLVNIRGSHAKVSRTVKSGEKQTLTIPLHKELAAGMLRAIFRQACNFIPEEDLRPWFFHQDR